VKNRLGPERRLGSDRGQNVAGQLKRICLKRQADSGGDSKASIEPRDHGQPFDFAIEIGLQERIVVFERHAAV
jgi:hypothetical protein